MSLEVVIVQHADKVSAGGDVGLTDLGREQARTAAGVLSAGRWHGLFSSPMRRAVETARPIAAVVGSEPVTDSRLRERMNWPGPETQSIDDFLHDWHQATQDRAWAPPSGDSSSVAGDRFLAFLDDLAATGAGRFLVVSHGGVTVDMARSLAGDATVHRLAPTAIAEGIPACRFTCVDFDGTHWVLRSIATMNPAV